MVATQARGAPADDGVMDTGLLQSIDQQTRLAGYNRLALLIFSLGGQATFGINVFKVREVLPMPALQQLPRAHRLVRGIFDCRGVVMPVVDLAAALGLAGGQQASHVVVTEFNRRLQAFAVGGVERILHVDVADVLPPEDADGFLTAMTRFEQRTVQIVDVERVLVEIGGGGEGIAAAAPQQQNGWRALIADDSVVARRQVEDTVRSLGLDCICVPDGARALEWLRDQAAADRLGDLALVISDVEMPRLDGYALTAEIRRDPTLQGLFVLLHTSLSGVSNSAMVTRVGADRFITKFCREELARAIAERLQALGVAEAA